MARGFNMDVTSKACCWGREKESLEKGDFFPPATTGIQSGRELCVLKCSGKEFRQIKQTVESLESIISH